MKKLTERGLSQWANDWLAGKRPGEVKPFWMTLMLAALQDKLEEMNDATETRKQPEDDQQQHS